MAHDSLLGSGGQGPSQGPFSIDTHLLSDPYDIVLSAQQRELQNRFSDWMISNVGGIREWTSYNDYLHVYGQFTPIVLLALPEGLAESSLKTFFPAASELLMTGRVIAFDAIDDRDYPHVIQRWKRDTFRTNLFEIPVRAEQNFDGLMTYATKTLRKLLERWEANRRKLKGASQNERGSLNSLSSQVKSKGAYHFVSYSRANLALVEPVCAELKELRINLWFDLTSIPGGEIFVESIHKGIQDAGGILPFCSKLFCDSDWCLREMLFAIDQSKRISPAWITNPALFGRMKLLLNIYQATIIQGMSARRAARAIQEALASAIVE